MLKVAAKLITKGTKGLVKVVKNKRGKDKPDTPDTDQEDSNMVKAAKAVGTGVLTSLGIEIGEGGLESTIGQMAGNYVKDQWGNLVPWDTVYEEENPDSETFIQGQMDSAQNYAVNKGIEYAQNTWDNFTPWNTKHENALIDEFDPEPVQQPNVPWNNPDIPWQTSYENQEDYVSSEIPGGAQIPQDVQVGYQDDVSILDDGITNNIHNNTNPQYGNKFKFGAGGAYGNTTGSFEHLNPNMSKNGSGIFPNMAARANSVKPKRNWSIPLRIPAGAGSVAGQPDAAMSVNLQGEAIGGMEACRRACHYAKLCEEYKKTCAYKEQVKKFKDTCEYKTMNPYRKTRRTKYSSGGNKKCYKRYRSKSCC
jgi:hypothetical protein